MDVTVTFLEFKKKGWFLPKKHNQKKYQSKKIPRRD